MSQQLHTSRHLQTLIMSKQSIFRAVALRRGDRLRPLSSSALSTSLSTTNSTVEARNRYSTVQATWGRNGSRYSSAIVKDAPSIRWFSTDDGDKKKSKKKAEEEKSEDKVEEGKEESDNKKKAAATTPKEDDDCPPWQNPLHHNNPDNEKIFAEDFGPGEEMVPMDLPPMEGPNNPDKILASQEVYDLADEIVNLSMLEMKELVDKIGDHFGFDKPPFTGPGGGGGDGGDDDEDGAGEVQAAKIAFDLELVSFDAKAKIKVIKEVRAIAGLGLKEAKELVEGAPKVVMKDINKEMAEELQKKLEEVGATVEIV